jgi:DNA-binding transcriptional LysR family regulator
LKKEGLPVIEAAAIRYFREVTESGSIKQAATALRIAPSAISRQVQALEEELSVKLFERGARGMMLTDAGRLLYRYAVDNRHQLDGIRVKVQEFETMRRGQVKFAAVEGMVTNFLSNFVIDLSTDYPGISISMTVVGSRAVAEMVSRNEVDLGLVFGRAPRRELIELARMRQSLCLIASPKHSLAHRESCSVKELACASSCPIRPSASGRRSIAPAPMPRYGWKSATRRTRWPLPRRWPRARTLRPSCRVIPPCRRSRPAGWSPCPCATSGWRQRR